MTRPRKMIIYVDELKSEQRTFLYKLLNMGQFYIRKRGGKNETLVLVLHDSGEIEEEDDLPEMDMTPDLKTNK